MIFDLDYYLSHCLVYNKLTTVHSHSHQQVRSRYNVEQDIAEISAYAFIRLAEKTEN